MEKELRELINKTLKKRNKNWTDLRLNYNTQLTLSSINKIKRLKEMNHKENKELIKIIKKYL